MRYLRCYLVLIILFASIVTLLYSTSLDKKQENRIHRADNGVTDFSSINRSLSVCEKSKIDILFSSQTNPDTELAGKPEHESQLEENFSLKKTITKEPRTDIFFLKIHKCASSTIQNILMRFGYKNGLDFVLPKRANYLGNPKYFMPSMIDNSIRTINGKYNIFTHHTRFNETSIRAVMNKKAVFVTILRNPAELYESLFTYYKLEKRYHMNLTTLIDNYSMTKEIQRPQNSRYGYNQMCFDLGMQEKYFNDRRKVRRLISRIEKNFELVMLADYMEVSLILLADLMNWPLSDVTFVNLNARKPSDKMKLDSGDRKMLRRLNSCDSKVHNHFLRKFKRQIFKYGVNRMKKDVKKLQLLNENFYRDCIKEEITRKTIRYTVRNSDQLDCNLAVKSELLLTTELRHIQQGRRTKMMALEGLIKMK